MFPGWVTWKDEVPMHLPVVQMHDSGLIARHDYCCPVCARSKAIYRIDQGVFYPCDRCTREGWRLVPPKRWVPKWLRSMLGDAALAKGEGE